MLKNKPNCELCKKEYSHPFYCTTCVAYMCYECLKLCTTRSHKYITTINFTCKLCKKCFTHDRQSNDLNICLDCFLYGL